MIVLKKLMCLFFCIYLYYYNSFFYKDSKTLLLIAIFSCNRYYYLNKTLTAFSNHLNLYENDLIYNIIYLDQGTTQRVIISLNFKIRNIIFMNPSGYTLSFNIVFSYLYTKYILLLEEDWEVVEDIEKLIFHPSFITESILILDLIKIVYGILLRNINDIYVNCTLNVSTKMGKHVLYILQPQKNRYSFTNGASIYRSSDLKHIKYYINELTTSQYFRKNKYRMGFTYKGIKGRINSSNTQFVMKHIGKKTSRNGICNKWLY